MGVDAHAPSVSFSSHGSFMLHALLFGVFLENLVDAVPSRRK